MRASPAEISDFSEVIASGETSARVCKQTHWQWAFAAKTAVFHLIAPTCGRVVAAEFLAGAKPDVWMPDRLAAQAPTRRRDRCAWRT